MDYELHTLDIVNEEVNDEWTTGEIIHLMDRSTIIDLKNQLVNIGRMAHNFPVSKINLEFDGDDFFVCNGTHKIYKLCYIKDTELNNFPVN